MRFGKKVRTAGVVAAVGMICTSCATFGNGGDAGEDDPINIAGSLDLSGAAADVGQDVLDGIEYAVRQINADGGVLGRELEFHSQDNGTDTDKSVQQARSLIQDGAVFLLAPQSSASALAVSTLVSQELATPTCVSSSNSDELTIEDFQPYIFEMGPNSYMEMNAVAQQLAKEPHKRYAVISADYAGGRANADRFKEFMQEYNPDAEVVVEDYPPFGASNYQATINKVLAADPDFVWTVLFGADLITFNKQATSVGFYEQIDNNFMALYDSNTMTALGKSAPVDTLGWQRAPFNLFLEQGGDPADYVEGFTEQVGAPPSDWATLGYGCVRAWAQAVEAAGTTDADAVMEAIETEEFSSVRGPITFGPFDHQAEVPVYIGSVAQNAELGTPVLEIEATVPGAEVRPSEETVEELRGN